MKLKIDFFRKKNGEAPVRDFLKALPKSDRVAVGRDLRKLQDGTRRGMPYERNLGAGLSEVRATTSRGAIRIFFTLLTLPAMPVMMLLHAIFKKSQKTPKADLDLARSRARDVHDAYRKK
jgi:phage-related protein